MSEQLKDRLADLVADQPPMSRGSADDLRAGRGRLRRRRATVVAGTAGLAVAAVVLGTSTTWFSVPRGEDQPGPAASGPTTAATAADPGALVLDRCTQVDNGALDPTTFGRGSRVVTMETDKAGDVNAVVLSADGRTWGSCWLSGSSTTEFNGTASAYPMTSGRPRGSVSETAPMSFGRGHFWYVDRFPPDVERVTLTSGRFTMSATAVDGFVAFMRDVPDLGDRAGGFEVSLYDAYGRFLGGRANAPGDASLPPAYRTWVPDQPLPDGGAGR